MALSDVDLMQRFLEGDEEAFATIVHRYECLLLGIARQMLFDHDLAQDACQYTWLKLFLQKPRGEVSLKSWLITVVFHWCLDEKRRKKRTPFLFSSLEFEGEGLDSVIDLFPDPGPSPEQLAEDDELSTLIQAAFEQLPEKYRAMLYLRAFGGYSFKEISEHLSQKEGTVKTRMGRARPLLRRILDQKA